MKTQTSNKVSVKIRKKPVILPFFSCPDATVGDYFIIS